MIQKALKVVVLSGLAVCLAAAPQASAASEERAAKAVVGMEQNLARRTVTTEAWGKVRPVVLNHFYEMRQVRANHESDTSRRG